MADDFKAPLSLLRSKAEQIQRHIDSLSKTAELFPAPDQWPEVLDKFLAVSHMHSDAMSQDLSLSVLDSLLLKPLAVPEGLEAEYIPELWRTKLEPEEEREERLLVDQYKNEFELTSTNYPDHQDLFEFANNKVGKYNEMVERLSSEFSKLSQQFKKDLSSNAFDIDRNYSLKIEMPDYSQRLFEYDEAIRRGEKLNQSDSLKRDRQMEEEARLQSQKNHQQQIQRQAQAKLTPEEEQQRMFRESKERTERTERETEIQMATLRNEAKSANLRQSTGQGRGIGPGTSYDMGTGEPPTKRAKRQ